MKQHAMDVIVTCDEGYLGPLRTMLYSLRASNQGAQVRIWLLHKGISLPALEELERFCSVLGLAIEPVTVDRALLDGAKCSERYPQEMYYRLLAPSIIKAPIERALYLDPDILVINPLDDLFEIDLHGNAFAAASHLDAVHPATALNKARLSTSSDYFNTGVILFDIARARKSIYVDELFSYVKAHEQVMLFPDQDLFNSLFGAVTLRIPDEIWNYDARKYPDNIIRTWGTATLDWVMEHTAILHFCGKNKPWAPGYRGQFASLYKHYDVLAQRVLK